MSAGFTWNHRVIRHTDPWGDVYYTFAEVHYDENDKPEAYTTVCMVGDSVSEMQQLADRLLTATAQPVLEAAIFEQEERQNVAGQIVEPPNRDEWVNWGRK